MENDLKLIYAGMLEGDFFKNVNIVRGTFKGLGQIVLALEELDNSDSSPYFSKDTYNLLNKLARQRNYYCHQCSIDFCYDPYFRESAEFLDALEKLKITNFNIKSVQEQTSIHREQILARYSRV